MRKRIISLVFIFQACVTPSRAWIVNSTNDALIIGYNRGNGPDSQKELEAEIQPRIRKVCGNRKYQTKSDNLKSEQYNYVTPQFVTSTTDNRSEVSDSHGNRFNIDGHLKTTTTVPVNHTGTYSWREIVIFCEECRPRIGIGYINDTNQVNEINPHMPAAKAGIQVGDKILNMNGNAFGKDPHFLDGINSNVILERENKIITVVVTPKTECSFD